MSDTFKTSCHYGGPFVKILFRANPCFIFSLFVNNGKPSKIVNRKCKSLFLVKADIYIIPICKEIIYTYSSNKFQGHLTAIFGKISVRKTI